MRYEVSEPQLTEDKDTTVIARNGYREVRRTQARHVTLDDPIWGKTYRYVTSLIFLYDTETKNARPLIEGADSPRLHARAIARWLGITAKEVNLLSRRKCVQFFEDQP